MHTRNIEPAARHLVADETSTDAKDSYVKFTQNIDTDLKVILFVL